MAEIKTYPFFHHLRADPTAHVRHLVNGREKNVGAGLAFWFRPRTAALSQVPLEDRQQALLFHARTADFQDVTVQATVSYRVTDPVLAATRIDFAVDPDTGAWTSTPMEMLGTLLTEFAQQPALEQLAAMTMADALVRGIGAVTERVATALADEPRLVERGMTVTDVRVAGQEHPGERPLATAEQIHQLADAIRPHLRTLVLLAGFGALRRGELFGLERRDVDVVAGQLSVQRQAVFLKDGTRKVTAPKSAAGVRTVSLSPFVIEALQEHLATWTAALPTSPVFVGERGGPLGTVSLQACFDEARQATGLTQFTLHDLRYAGGTMAAWTGATTKELMARLGHSTHDAALLYQHAAQARDAEIAAKLDAIGPRSSEPLVHQLDEEFDRSTESKSRRSGGGGGEIVEAQQRLQLWVDEP